MTRKHTPTAAVPQKPAKQAVKAEPFSALVDSAAAGKSRDSWNGMQVFVMEPATGRVLVSVGADTPHDPASLTKMALFYVAQEAIRDRKLHLDTFITITPEMANAPYSKLVPGERLKVARLLDAMMIESDNGAARIIASQVSVARDGKDAVDLMNAAAARMGLKQTHFINVGGLPAYEDPISKPGEPKSTTAREMATLIGRIHQEFPAAMKHHMTAQTVEYGRDPKIGGNLHQANHLLLKPGSPVRLPDGYELAAKTGRTALAGNVIAAYVTAPDGRELISVVFAPHAMAREQAKAMGVPPALLGDGAAVNGNRPRDTLVRQLTDHFIGPKAQAVAQQRPVPAPALATPPVVSPQPPAPPSPPAPAAAPAGQTITDPQILHTATALHATQKLPPNALKAVEECRASISVYSRPGPQNDATATISKIPKEVAEDSAERDRARAELAKAESAFAADRRKQPKAKPPEKLLALRRMAAEKAEAVADNADFMARLNAIENQSDPALYTQANYARELASGKKYIDAFVDQWDGKLPTGGKPALRAKLYGTIEGAAGIESGFSEQTVKSAANRGQFSGIFQTSWPYIHDAKIAFDNSPAMRTLLDQNPRDKAVIEFLFDPERGTVAHQLSTARGLPTPSFAGQGATMAAMTVAAYKSHVMSKDRPADLFSGQPVYQRHMLGAGNLARLEKQLTSNPHKPGASAISEAVYRENFMMEHAPYAPLNDLNPTRLTYRQATPQHVVDMIRDKSIHAYTKAVKNGLPAETVKAFEIAYFPEWTNNPTRKSQDIARITFQKELGKEVRDAAEEAVNAANGRRKDEILCDILRPLPSLPQIKTPPSR